VGDERHCIWGANGDGTVLVVQLPVDRAHHLPHIAARPCCLPSRLSCAAQLLHELLGMRAVLEVLAVIGRRIIGGEQRLTAHQHLGTETSQQHG